MNQLEPLEPLEHVFLVIGINRPIPARLIGVAKDGKHKFEPLKSNFGEHKNSLRIVFVKDFDICNHKIEGKKVLVIK